MALDPEILAAGEWRTKPTDRFILRWIKLHLAAPLAPRLARIPGLSPVTLTVTATLLGVAAGILLACRQPGWAVLGALAAQVLDGVDGQVARLTGRSSRAGAFWDSVLDRYTDGAMVLGLGIFVLRSGPGPEAAGALPAVPAAGALAAVPAGSALPAVPVGGALPAVPVGVIAGVTALALIGSNLISYSTARAATLDLDLGAPTLVSKGSRMSLMILGAAAGLCWPPGALVVLAILAVATNLVVVGRLRRVRRTAGVAERR